ncbi:ABC transporter ATP-binding protein [Streptomyces nanshensis]|uniref:ABC transporter n=1 Tax=Streptomyces nanshensis TaxID=518642 RepID=A0A1E7L9E4_9ACTN|nr:ABC transporter ATP-binding protein [Streptomyces nanshensis]OEV12816.1 hypothetical protein AN218_06255 [Streptomyces nanshensis]
MIKLLTALFEQGARRRFRGLLAGLVLVGVLEGVTFVLLAPVLSTMLKGDHVRMWWWIGALALVAALYGAALAWTTHVGYRVGTNALSSIYAKLGDHLSLLPLGWFNTERTGSISRLVTKGAVNIAGAPAHLLRPVVTAVVSPLTVMLFMLVIEWRIGLALLLSAPVALGAQRISNAMITRADVAWDASAADANARVLEYARMQPVLRAFGRHIDGNELLDASLTHESAMGRRLLLRGATGFSLYLAALQGVIVVAIFLAIYLTLEGGLSASLAIALLVLTVRFVEPLVAAADLGSAARLATESLKRINAVLDSPVMPEPSVPRRAKNSEVVLDDVSFGYDEDAPVLRGVSFRAPAGGVTAIVGPSGSGKSTVLRLISRFYDADDGAVLIGGEDVRNLGTGEVMRNVAMVFQDVYLFEGSILDNIRIGRRDASDEDVMEAARTARVDEIAERLPDGWETQVGEGGTALSGGERQRLSVARALLKNAPVLLLDEATAALDPENEAAVHEAIRHLAHQRTVIVIAHRINTVVAADRIVVLDRGAVEDTGTHTELLERGGRYAEFWSQRQQAAGWRLVHD